jgi:hypothetical protein
MNTGELEIIPVDDIGLDYSNAGKYQRMAVSAILSGDTECDFLLSVLHPEELEALHEQPGRWGDNVGFGMCVCGRGQYIPVMLAHALNAFTTEEQKELAGSGISYWLAQEGRERIKQIVDDAERILDAK